MPAASRHARGMPAPVTATVEMMIGGRDLTEPRLDPAGGRLAFVARQGRTRSIVVVDLDVAAGAACERVLVSQPVPAAGRGRGGGCFAWCPDGAAIVFASADGGLWHQPVPGGPPRACWPADPGRAASAPAVAPDGSFVVFVVDQAEVWAAPLDGSGDPPRRLDDGEFAFCLDPAVSPDARRVRYQAWSPPDMPWDGAVVVTVDLPSGDRWVESVPDGAWQQPRFAPDGTTVGVHDGDGVLRVRWGERTLLADDPHEQAEPTWGPGQRSFAVAPDGERVVLHRNEDGFGRLVVVEVATGAATPVGRGVHGALSWAGDRVAAMRSGARTPTQIVVYDTTTWARRVVAVGPVLGWDDVALVEPDCVTATSSDGATLHGRRYRAPRSTGRLLCWVHGGPTGQWPVEFVPRIALWIDRGWDVLVPDHRGSTGHGRAYQQALHGRWGELDVADTAALLAASHDAGVGTPERTVVIGGSAGGMTVLGLLMGDTAELVAAGVAAYPVTDLVELADRSHRFEAHYTDTLVAPRAPGDPVLRERSPLRRAAELRRPLLLHHGTEDVVVPVEGTIAFAAAARAAGADVELELFEGEGHGFADPDAQRREDASLQAFLDRVVPSTGAGRGHRFPNRDGG